MTRAQAGPAEALVAPPASLDAEARVAALALLAAEVSAIGAAMDGGAPDAPMPMDGGPDGGPDGGARLSSCLDTPDELPRPPIDRLPCDLIPPGLTL